MKFVSFLIDGQAKFGIYNNEKVVEDYLIDHSPYDRPNYQQLLETGHKKGKLRAHSDMCWNTACNEWALSFWNDFDIMVEAKHKNLASKQLLDMTKTLCYN